MGIDGNYDMAVLLTCLLCFALVLFGVMTGLWKKHEEILTTCIRSRYIDLRSTHYEHEPGASGMDRGLGVVIERNDMKR